MVAIRQVVSMALVCNFFFSLFFFVTHFVLQLFLLLILQYFNSSSILLQIFLSLNAAPFPGYSPPVHCENVLLSVNPRFLSSPSPSLSLSAT